MDDRDAGALERAARPSEGDEKGEEKGIEEEAGLGRRGWGGGEGVREVCGVRACVVPMRRWMAVRVAEGVDDFGA